MPFPYRFMLFEALIVGGLLYALLRGGAPERITGLLLLVAWLLSMALNSHTGFSHFESGVFAIDLLLFATLYMLSIFTRRFWPIWMCAMQGMGVLAHVVMLLSPWEAAGYAIMLQFWGYPMQVLLIVATRRHQQRLRRYGADPAWVWSR